ncbi:MFS transporter [Pseudomarimonas arenosa]|uniref:MFS transporter n=1 Tax=Pseudomarimonas arenosa TaxID=2774145 RepID=A0AAW3ZS71_9GAMM|nr:MFS transporter [Pseudomarimonas arenosa]MBD8527362.1 MFS transporter [Pseudomarimonas arenosa]
MNQPRLSFWQIWNMSFGFLGIQFGWGLQMANMSAIYQMLGAEESELPILWLAAPVTGLLVQPIIGYMSDRTWNRLGRRRPYFLVGAILASLALVFMPSSSTLWMAAGLLWILDASVNISMEPFRAFVADKLPQQQRTQGFAVQSVFIGLGAVLSSALPYLLTNYFGVAGTSAPGTIPPAVSYAFYIGAAAFLLAVLWTVLSTPEAPPPDMAAFERMKAEHRGVSGFLSEFVHGLNSMPQTMRQLAAVQFFTWMGLFCMWICFSPAIAKHVFGAVKGSDNYADLVSQAGQWTGVCFSVYNGVCFVFAFLLLGLAQRYSARTLHIVSLLLGGAGLLSVALIQDQHWLLLSMVGVGIAWASILSMPYAMLSNCLPPAKMGFYMGVFNFFIVLPQIAISLGLGKLMELMPDADSLYVVMSGGGAMVLAALLTLRVRLQPTTSAAQERLA